MSKFQAVLLYIRGITTLVIMVMLLSLVITVIVLHLTIPVVNTTLERAGHMKRLYPVDRALDLWT